MQRSLGARRGRRRLLRHQASEGRVATKMTLSTAIVDCISTETVTGLLP
ncbi:hypothetical protein [Streptomyces longispororuber]|nr:hypothetical protein [Streptomyces longispororuber]